MSEYIQCKTKMKDKQALLEALAEMGYPQDKLVIDDQGTNLYGYHGDKRSDKAHIIIRRKHIGDSSNDVGFRRNSDGTYEAIISDFDQRSMGFNQEWRDNLANKYATNLAVRTARAKGFEIVKKVEGKKVILTCYK